LQRNMVRILLDTDCCKATTYCVGWHTLCYARPRAPGTFIAWDASDAAMQCGMLFAIRVPGFQMQMILIPTH